jgi:hypothetical protein
MGGPFDRSWFKIYSVEIQGVQYIKNARTNQMMPMNIGGKINKRKVQFA